MSYLENNRIQLNSLAIDDSNINQDKLPVLYAVPIKLKEHQTNFIHDKYSEMILPDLDGIKNLLSFQSIDDNNKTGSFFSKKLQELILFGKFLLLMRANVKSYTSVHLFMFSSVSFLFQIIPLIILGKFYRKNVIIEFFDFSNYYYPEESRTFIRFFLKIADCVIVVSDRQSRTLRQKKIKATSIKTHFQINDIKPRVIEEVQPKILVSADFEDVLNINCLFEAYVLVKQKYPRTELILSGNGSLKNHLLSLISSKSLSGVSIVDEDSKQLYKEADVFVHCYHIEYFAQEILSAMAHGIPVIASPIGMVNNLIQKEHLLMYQYNDYSTLADNLLLLVEDSTITKNLSLNGALFARELSRTDSPDSLVPFYQNLS